MAKVNATRNTPDQTVASAQLKHLVRERALLRNEKSTLLAAADRILEIEALLTAINSQIQTVRPRLPPDAEEDE